jgi:hypothetical protein
VLPEPWIGIDPPSNGMRITLTGVLDVTVPGGPGWTQNKKGTRWRYDESFHGSRARPPRVRGEDRRGTRHAGARRARSRHPFRRGE